VEAGFREPRSMRLRASHATRRASCSGTGVRAHWCRCLEDHVDRRLRADPPGVRKDPVSAVSPVRWLLELCLPPDGAALTQSGYLPRASVVEVAERFEWWDWEKPPRSL
jgi:hypothetical protein